MFCYLTDHFSHLKPKMNISFGGGKRRLVNLSRSMPAIVMDFCFDLAIKLTLLTNMCILFSEFGTRVFNLPPTTDRTGIVVEQTNSDLYGIQPTSRSSRFFYRSIIENMKYSTETG